MNWVKKLTEIITEHEAELDQEAVTKFRQQKQEYMEKVEDDSPEVVIHEKQAVQSVRLQSPWRLSTSNILVKRLGWCSSYACPERSSEWWAFAW